MKIYHVVDHFISGRHFIVLASSKKAAIKKVLSEVPDLPKGTLEKPYDRLEVESASSKGTFTEISAEIKVEW